MSGKNITIGCKRVTWDIYDILEFKNITFINKTDVRQIWND